MGLEVRKIKDRSFEIDVQNLFPDACPVVFDVGAHIGDSTETFRRIFPKARIFSFEPFPEFYQKSVERFREDPLIQFHAYGLSDISGKKKLHTFNACLSVVSPLINQGEFPKEAAAQEGITIETRVLENVAREILKDDERIGFLKIDAERHDLAILKDAESLLKAGKVDAVYIEVMFVDHFQGAPLFPEISSYMNTFSCRLFSLYDVKKNPKGQIRFGNAIFLSPERQKSWRCALNERTDKHFLIAYKATLQF